MKGSKPVVSQPHTEMDASEGGEFEDIVEYKLNFDFSKLIGALKQHKQTLTANTEEISSLRTSVLKVCDDKVAMQNRIQECGDMVEKASVLSYIQFVANDDQLQSQTART